MLSTARRAARRTARLLVGVVGAATLVFALIILIPGMLGLERYVITGGSMSGSIERGDLVFSESRPVAPSSSATSSPTSPRRSPVSPSS